MRISTRPTVKKIGRIGGKAYSTAKTATRVLKYGSKAFGYKPGVKAAEAAEKAMHFGETIHHTLGRMSSLGKKLSMPLMGGIIDSPATGDITESFYSCKPKGKRAPAALKLSQRTTYIVDNAFELGSIQGTQSYADFCFTPTGSGTTSPAGNAGTFTGNYLAPSGTVNYGNLNNLVKVMQNTNSSGTSRSFLERCDQEVVLTNSNNSPCIVEVYECVAKHDLSTPAQFNAPLVYSPGVYWTAGLTNSSTAGSLPIGQISGNLETAGNIGARPWDSQLFSDYWRIAGRYTLTLASGASHRHKSSYNVNTIVNPSRYSNSSLLQGLTRNILFVIRGINGYDVTSSTPLVTAAKCWITVNQKYVAWNFTGSQNTVYNSEFVRFAGTDTVNVEATNSPSFVAASSNP
jgi:hypothetical protein